MTARLPEIQPRHRQLADEYLIDLNGLEAAKRAGFSDKGAKVTASRILNRPEVKAYIQAKLDARSEKAGVKLERVLEELAHIAFIDPKDFYDEKGQLLSMDKMPEHARRALCSIESDETQVDEKISTRVHKVKYEKVRALCELREHLSPRKVELTGKDGKPLVPGEKRVDLTKLPTEVLEKLLLKAAKG